MKTKYLTTLLITALTMLAEAADKPQSPLSVAVYDFKGDAEAASFTSKVTSLVTANLSTETNLVMLERAELTKALSEQAFGISGMVSSDAAAKIGQITGAKVLVAGQVIKTGKDHLIIVANVIGTETGRLFADKVEGAADNLSDLTSDLSRKIAQTITSQTTNLIAVVQESSAERLERIIKSITGTNRPSVSINFRLPRGKPTLATPTGEFGIILLKAGFPVVDDNSDRKPDVEITGVVDISAGPRHGGVFSYRAVIELKVQERRSGNIIIFDRQESTAIDATRAGADRSAQVNAVDALAERILPLLAK
jgi:TolB-like protein